MKFMQSKYNVHIEYQGNKYVFNTFSNGSCKLNDATYKKLIHDTLRNTSFLDTLVRKDYVVSVALDICHPIYWYCDAKKLEFSFDKEKNIYFEEFEKELTETWKSIAKQLMQ